LVAGHGVEDGEEFSGDGDDGDLERLSSGYDSFTALLCSSFGVLLAVGRVGREEVGRSLTLTWSTAFQVKPAPARGSRQWNLVLVLE
jgi:hypothetical protein